MQIRTHAAAIVTELKQQGIDAEVGPARELDRDVADIQIGSLTIMMRVVAYGAQKGRIDYQGYVKAHPGVSSYERPSLNKTQTAGDAPAARTAKALVSKIIKPSEEPIAAYEARIAKHEASRAALPGVVSNMRSLGFTVHEPRDESATSASFYFDHYGANLSGEVRDNGAVWLRHGSFSAEQIAIMVRALHEHAASK